MCYSYPIKNASRRAVRPTILLTFCLVWARKACLPGAKTPPLCQRVPQPYYTDCQWNHLWLETVDSALENILHFHSLYLVFDGWHLIYFHTCCQVDGLISSGQLNVDKEEKVFQVCLIKMWSNFYENLLTLWDNSLINYWNWPWTFLLLTLCTPGLHCLGEAWPSREEEIHFQASQTCQTPTHSKVNWIREKYFKIWLLEKEAKFNFWSCFIL